MPRQPTPSPLTMYPLDKGRIIAIVPTTNDPVILLETATMSQIFSIPTGKNPSAHTVFYASLENKVAACWFRGIRMGLLQMWEFSHQRLRWTVSTTGYPSAGSISPAGTRLLTYEIGRFGDTPTAVTIKDVSNGEDLACMYDDTNAPSPLDITFDSEDRFSFHCDTHREPYVISLASQTGTYITRCAKQRLEGQVQERYHRLDDGHEWVFCGLQRICWVPPGYIGSVPTSHCWAGSSLVMVGRDGMLRKLDFS